METWLQEIEIYVTRDGKVPFSEWLNNLRDMRGRAKIRVRIDRVRLGNFGLCRLLGSGLFELKVDFGPGYRVYFGRDGSKLVILLCGGDKGTQKKDIERAKKYWGDYRSRTDEKKD